MALMKIYLVGGNKDFLVSTQTALEETINVNADIVVGKLITPKELAEKAADCEILVVSPSGFERLTKEHMQGLPLLKYVSTTSVGTDWVDLEAAKELKITVSNQQGVNAESVAEHCFGMILDLSKRITEADRGIREKGEYTQYPYLGNEIYKKTLGIIGLGEIGKRVARIANGFSMNVIGINKNGKKVKGVELVSLEKLLKESEIIAVTVPLTQKTEGFLSEKQFKLMKRGVIIVSISREKVIDKKAVLKAVNSGKIFGFGFDAEIMVPIKKSDPYLKNDRIVITPHTASYTVEADKAYIYYTIENVKAILAGKPIRVVN